MCSFTKSVYSEKKCLIKLNSCIEHWQTIEPQHEEDTNIKSIVYNIYLKNSYLLNQMLDYYNLDHRKDLQTLNKH